MHCFMIVKKYNEVTSQELITGLVVAGASNIDAANSSCFSFHTTENM